MKTHPPTELVPWQCEIITNDGLVQKAVFPASNPKDAFLQFVCFIPSDWAGWQSPGWRHVEVSPYQSARET
jgi:hypothetical protein